MTYIKTPHLALWKTQNWVIRLYEFMSRADMPLIYSTDHLQLYNHPAYLFIQSEAPIYTLHIEHIYSKQLTWLHFRKINTTLINGYKSPWGGFDGDAILLPNELSQLFPSILEAIGKLLNCSTIHLSLPPTLYFPTDSEYVLKHLVIKSIETIYLPVTTPSFLNHCRSNEKRRYKKCIREQMVVKPIEVTKGVYDFITQCYAERQYQISITYPILAALVARFPNRYAAAGVFHHNRLVAAVIYVRVNDTIIYNFLPASLLSYQQMSPIILLYEYIYLICQSTGTKYLDLGVSHNRDGSYKKSLAQFKLNMGGKCIPKWHLEFDVHQGLTSS